MTGKKISLGNTAIVRSKSIQKQQSSNFGRTIGSAALYQLPDIYLD